MIGFEMKARGFYPDDLNVGKPFQITIGRWTEGDQSFLKFASVVRTAGRMVESPAAIASTFTPEKIFKNIKDTKLLRICDLPWDCHLWVSGDVVFSYHFKPKKSGMQNLMGFMNCVSALETKIGDQVMIAICDALDGFATWCIAKGISHEAVGLRCDLDL